jgi:cytoskeletal protein CcmA (bactofilin family)
MTMFTRTDKSAEGGETQPAPSRGASPAEPKRSQATAQPMAAPARPPAATSDVHGVSVISKALKITGQLESTEDIRIDGQIDGDVRGLSVTVGANAKVKGTVYGDTVELAGSVDGCIEAKKVVLTATAHMAGDVIHQDIRIESGAFIDGHLKPEHGKTAGAAHANGQAAHKSSPSSSPSREPAAAAAPNGAGTKA